MAHVILSLATNRRQKSNLAKARQCLGEVFSEATYSTEHWTEPFSSRRSELYLNQLVSATTDLTVEELEKRLKQIEADFGRTAGKRLKGIVPIDLDILQYDNLKLHERDWERPYVSDLLKELL